MAAALQEVAKCQDPSLFPAAIRRPCEDPAMHPVVPDAYYTLKSHKHAKLSTMRKNAGNSNGDPNNPPYHSHSPVDCPRCNENREYFIQQAKLTSIALFSLQSLNRARKVLGVKER